MGKKKRQVETSNIPIWIPKKPKSGRDDPFTPLNALMQYSLKFKLGQISYQVLKQPPNNANNKWVMRAIVGEDEMGFGEGESREAAMEKGALVTLHLFDPTGKSLAANVVHHDPNELTKLATQIENVKPEDILRAKGGGPMPPMPKMKPPTLIPLHPGMSAGPPGFGMMPPSSSPHGQFPMPPPGPGGMMMPPPPHMMPNMMPPPSGFHPGFPPGQPPPFPFHSMQPPPGWMPPNAMRPTPPSNPQEVPRPHNSGLPNSETSTPAPPDNTSTTPTLPQKPAEPFVGDLIFKGEEDFSMEERRAMLQKYTPTK